MAATFSYAQAAKGMSSTATPASQSKAPSGATTPALPTEPTGLNWAEEGEADGRAAENGTDGSAKVDEATANGLVSQAQKQGLNAHQAADSGISSPSVGASSSSAMGKEDDASSVPNAPSESTWDNKSQTSNTADRSADQADVGPEKKHGKDKKKEKKEVPAKPLQDAPLPVVNFWKQRAEANAKAKPGPTPSPPRSAASTTKPSVQTGAARAGEPTKANVGRKGREGGNDENNAARVSGAKSKDEDQAATGRRPQGDASRGRRAATAPQLPPVKDQESWPTPDTVQDEDRKKAQEKSEKDRPAAATKSHGKNEWVSLPYTPSVVFNTPINPGARRGGRGGSRGGAQAGGRSAPAGANGASSVEKDSAPATGDQSRRGRADAASQEASPTKAKRASSAASIVGENQRGEAGAHAVRPPNPEGTTGSSAGSNNLPRNNTAPRQKMNRKYEQSGSSERRKDDGSVSPSDTTGNGRRGSTAIQQEAEQGLRRSFSQEGQQAPSRSGGSERRSGQYGSVSGRERGENRSRGNVRGGRNGGHGYQNGHHTSFTNGHSFALPRSPPGYATDQHTSFFGQGSQQQRGYRGGRSQSLQTDSVYGRSHPGYPGGQPALAPPQTYMNGVYDYAMPPLSAMPFGPYMDPYHLVRAVLMQLEYYFSVDNLCKDMYLRKHMDSQGFVSLSFIVDFNRVKTLTTDINLIRYACTQSATIDYRVGADGKDRLRRGEGWEQWVLTMNERDTSAQNDGPEELHQPSVVPPQAFDPRFMMQFPGAPADMPTSPSHGTAGPYQPFNGIAQGTSPVNGGPAGSDLPNGERYLDAGASQFSSMNVGAVPSFAPNASPNGINPEADSFSDAQTKGLTVIVRKREASEKQPPFHSEASRTFSDGSIDSRSIADELHKFDAKQPGPQTNGHGPVEANEVRKSGVLTRSLSPSSSPSSSNNPAMRLFWVKDQDSPVKSESLPADANVVLYTDLYRSALNQRDAASVGTCPYDMDVLYQFWSHFLIRNFNTWMYDEFRRLAFEDFEERTSDAGMKCLMKYYGEALSSQSDIRERVARHYVELVIFESSDRGGPAFKQLRSAWRNGALNLKNRKKINAFVDSDLKMSLEQ